MYIFDFLIPVYAFLGTTDTPALKVAGHWPCNFKHIYTYALHVYLWVCSTVGECPAEQLAWHYCCRCVYLYIQNVNGEWYSRYANRNLDMGLFIPSIGNNQVVKFIESFSLIIIIYVRLNSITIPWCDVSMWFCRAVVVRRLLGLGGHTILNIIYSHIAKSKALKVGIVGGQFYWKKNPVLCFYIEGEKVRYEGKNWIWVVTVRTKFQFYLNHVSSRL